MRSRTLKGAPRVDINVVWTLELFCGKDGIHDAIYFESSQGIMSCAVSDQAYAFSYYCWFK